MTQYLIAFNDEWVSEHTADQIEAKSAAVRPVIDDMLAEGVLIFSHGFAVIDVPDDEAARYWAGRLVSVLDWPQEVHRFSGSGRGR
jgi:hypothetical protein